MNDDRWLQEMTQINQDNEARERSRLDERWDRLSAGQLSPEEEAELRALGATSEEAREAYEAFRPLGPNFQASVVKAIRKQMDEESIQEELRRALAGDEPALTRLVRKLTPVIQRRVARVFLSLSRGSSTGANIRQEVEDLTQDVFVVLFANGGKVLRSWKPRGLSLPNYVGLVAERHAIAVLRPDKRNPSKRFLTLPENLDPATAERGAEEITAWRELLQRLLDRLKAVLSPLGWHLFDLLFLRELTVSEVTRVTSMSTVAVYAWRSRLRRLACRLFQELSEDPDE